MSSQTLPSVHPFVDASALRSPERVLHSIAASARIEGMAAPRRVSFDEPRPGEPLAVLSLTWTSLADMRPWLPYFAAEEVHPYVRPDGSAHHTAYAEFGGWQVSLNAVDSARCDCKGDVTHMIGCAAMSYPADPVITGTPAEVLAHLADHYGSSANHDEAVRLGAEHHTLTIADVVTDLARPCPNGCSRNLLALQPPDGLVYCDGCGYTEPAPVAFSDAQRVQAEALRAAVTSSDAAIVHSPRRKGASACGASKGRSSNWANKVTCPDCRAIIAAALAGAVAK